MAKAKKLPSGQWRALVYDFTDSSQKRHYESFTSSTKKEAEFLAAEFAITKRKKGKNSLTVIKSIHKYIDAKKAVLSPGTIRTYNIAT